MKEILEGGGEGERGDLAEARDPHGLPDHTATVVLEGARLARQVLVPHHLVVLNIVLNQLHHVSIDSTVVCRDQLGLRGKDAQRFNSWKVGHTLSDGKQDCHVAVFTSEFILQQTVVISVADVKISTIGNEQGCCFGPSLLHVVFMETDVVEWCKPFNKSISPTLIYM